MTDDKIQQLRGTAERLAVNSWPNAAKLMHEAADELERLHKIEAAAKKVVNRSMLDEAAMIDLWLMLEPRQHPTQQKPKE